MLFSQRCPNTWKNCQGLSERSCARRNGTSGKPADKVTQGVVFVRQPRKIDMLMERLRTHMDERSIVFARTKHGSERRMKSLREGSGGLSPWQQKSGATRTRDQSARRRGDGPWRRMSQRGASIFRTCGWCTTTTCPMSWITTSTALAAPRAGRDGTATAFCAPDEMAYLRAIQKVMGKTIPVVGGEPWSADLEEEPQHNKRTSQGRRRGGRPQGGPGKPTGKPGANPAENQSQPRASRAAETVHVVETSPPGGLTIPCARSCERCAGLLRLLHSLWSTFGTSPPTGPFRAAWLVAVGTGAQDRPGIGAPMQGQSGFTAWTACPEALPIAF